MVLNIKCEECGKNFAPNNGQKHFIKESKARRMEFIVLKCGDRAAISINRAGFLR